MTYYRRLIRYLLNRSVDQSETHIQGWTKSEMTNLLELIGFSQIRIGFVQLPRHHRPSIFRSFFPHLTRRSLLAEALKSG
ncbi:MAG: hypothetical protein QW828_04220 [Candidatus Bathyarchaeia archaeon]